MLGYKQTLRICLLSYLAVLLSHIIYAFWEGAGIGRLVLIVSAVMYVLSIVLVLLIKKQDIIVYTLIVSVVISTTIIGYLVGTLGYSVLIFILMSTVLLIFTEPKYILVSGTVSLVSLLAYTVFLRTILLKSVDSMVIYIVYILIFVVGLVTQYIVCFNMKKFMVGMREKADEAEHANHSKMLFLGNLSHEIRTPTNAICGITELTLKEDLSPTVRENVVAIEKSCKHLITIINDILDYSKMEAGEINIIPVHYSLRKMINDATGMIKPQLGDKEVDLKLDIQEDLPDSLIGDETRISQVIYNLLSNAIKFTEKGFIVLKVSGETGDNNNIDLTVSITDSGIGIKKEDVPRLFVSFASMDSKHFKNHEGTGLGLAICKQIVSLMGGDIKVESAYGVGSKFTFSIPQKVAKESNVISYNASVAVKEAPRITAPDAKVLIVDDNAVNLKVSEGLLKTFGLKVDTCMSGRACLEILKAHKDYDILFIDHMMPELDGIDTLNMIRADSDPYMKSVPAIALTANVVNGIRDMFISEGFNDYVPKPIDMVWMNAILRKYIPIEKQK
jgi:signal transduction histidine kinase/ActR/RegA family two-component response regulator